MKVIKKDGTLEEFDGEKIVNAVNKSASRVMITLDDTAFHEIVGSVLKVIEEKGLTDIPVAVMHNIVEQVLDKYDPRIATSYRNYRNYKQDFVHVLDRVFQKSQVVRFQGDKENANTDSALVATKRCLIFNELNKRLYRKFFMTQEELQACRDGYIYIHDQSARLDTMNCCLFRVNEVMKGGFEMGNIWYNEPKTLDVFFDVLGDIILATASQQYGGFTVPEVDKLAAPYAEKSYKKYVDEYMEIRNQQTFTQEVHEWAMQKVERDFEQGFQGIEMKLNTVGSSRGDYPFITMTFGLATDCFGKMASKTSEFACYAVGENDLSLMKKLAAAGNDHGKFLRMINVTVDVEAPLYWWKEFDTYKVGTVANSCSTMHKIQAKEFTLEDFSTDHLSQTNLIIMKMVVDALNNARLDFLSQKDKRDWWQMIQLLPSSYNQKRTVQLNYAVLKNIYHARRNHKLDEWHTFCHFIESLPHSELITE